MVSVVIRLEMCLVASVDLLAYFARYPATALSVSSPVNLTGRISSWGPQVIGQPSGLWGCGGVVNFVEATAWVRMWSTSLAVMDAGGASTVSALVGSIASSRIRAWKWISPRA